MKFSGVCGVLLDNILLCAVGDDNIQGGRRTAKGDRIQGQEEAIYKVAEHQGSANTWLNDYGRTNKMKTRVQYELWARRAFILI